MSDWAVEVTFAQLIDEGVLEIGDGHRAKLDELTGGGPIFLRAGAMSERGFAWAECDRFGIELADRLENKSGRPGDTVVTTKGNSVGRTGYVGAQAPKFIYSPHLSYWRSRQPERLVSRFLYYWSRSPELCHQLHAMAFSTDMAPYLSLVDQKRLSISLPTPEDQSAIAALLGPLDDKIAVNERLVQTSSELSRREFERTVWNYGLDLALPQGYRTGTVAELCEQVGNGGTPRRGVDEYWQGGTIPWFKTGELSDGPLIQSEEKVTQAAVDNTSCAVWGAGTILVALYAAPTVGRLGILEVPSAFNQACSALLPKTGIGTHVLFETLRAIRPELQNIAVGAAQQNISQSVLRTFPVVVPPATIALKFHEVAGHLHRAKVSKMRENIKLSELRDTLLPRLMSGELRVKDAEQLVSDVV
jgi:type I restriction enzyme S subunit